MPASLSPCVHRPTSAGAQVPGQGTGLIKAVEIDNGISTFNIDVQIENSSKQQTATRMSIFLSESMLRNDVRCYNMLLSPAPPREPAQPGTFTWQSLSTPTHYQPFI